jgi:hypothetical protein
MERMNEVRHNQRNNFNERIILLETPEIFLQYFVLEWKKKKDSIKMYEK